MSATVLSATVCRLDRLQEKTRLKEGIRAMITVHNVNGRELTPCVHDRAWREVNRARAVWVDDQTIRLLYNPFLFPGYRKAALKRDRYICQWCGSPATTADHIIPSSKGGADRPVNLLASCGECNSRRGNRTATVYLREKITHVPKLLKVCYRITLATTVHHIRKQYLRQRRGSRAGSRQRRCA